MMNYNSIRLLKSALKKVTSQQMNFGYMERFTVSEHWAVREALEDMITIIDAGARNGKSTDEIVNAIVNQIKGKQEEPKWHPLDDSFGSYPYTCGYPVLLTVENPFGQKRICKAFTNYIEDGKFQFLTNEKGFCDGLSSRLSPVWKLIAWMELPDVYGEQAVEDDKG